MNRAALNPTYEFPPTDFPIPAAKNWNKSLSNIVAGFSGRTYARYSYVNTNATSIAPGTYEAWANTIWSYKTGTDFDNGEWPPSGAFDKQAARNNDNHPSYASDGLEHNAPTRLKNLYIKFPSAILLNRYSFEARSDCCPNQTPNSWSILGSNDQVTWDVIDMRSNINEWTLGMVQTFNVSMPSNVYTMFRLASYDMISQAEFRLYGSME